MRSQVEAVACAKVVDFIRASQVFSGAGPTRVHGTIARTKGLEVLRRERRQRTAPRVNSSADYESLCGKVLLSYIGERARTHTMCVLAHHSPILLRLATG